MDNNIRSIYENDAKKKAEQFQKYFDFNSIKEGSYIKAAFRDKEKTEWMWVRVKKVDMDKRTINGILNNDPVIVNMKDGDEVNISFDDTMEYLPKL